MTIRFDFSGVEQFLVGLEGRISPEQVFAHLAYQTVALHARRHSFIGPSRDLFLERVVEFFDRYVKIP